MRIINGRFYRLWWVWLLAGCWFISFGTGAQAELNLTWTHDVPIVLNSGPVAMPLVKEYRVLRQSKASRGFTHIATLPADARRWIDTTTRRNQMYWYQVVAIWGDEDRQFSNVANAKDR